MYFLLQQLKYFLVFNEVVQLCILYLPDAFKRYLKLSSETQPQIHKLKRFGKVKNILKSYLTDLIKVNTITTI